MHPAARHPAPRPDVHNQSYAYPSGRSNVRANPSVRVNHGPANVCVTPSYGHTFTHVNNSNVSHHSLHTYVETSVRPPVSVYVEHAGRPRNSHFQHVSIKRHHHHFGRIGHSDFNLGRFLTICALVSTCMLFMLAMML